MPATWQFFIDVGGTFTDCVARSPDGALHSAKLLNTDAGDAAVRVMRRIMGIPDDAPLGPVRIRLGTTRGTNALLERKGAAVAFVTTAGFADLLDIGTQARPDLFDLDIRKPPPLHAAVAELDERIAADGSVLTPLDETAAEAALRDLRAAGFDSVAICLINAYINDAHERAVAAIAGRIGFTQVSISTALSPTIKAIDRGDTAVLDAYLSPVIRSYVANLRRHVPEASMKLMTSAGGLVDADRFVGKDSILSGPAGGVVGFAAAATDAGFTRAIGFDMGGTSTDVARYDGRYEYEYSGQKAGVRIVAPMYAIETVAAGGGSVCAFDGQRLTVGPHSAGANPGPACYGRGGPLTITDANLFTGRIDPSRFPFPLDADAVRRRLDELAASVERDSGRRMSPHAIADGLIRVANLKMATAIRTISAARGYDPAEHVLVSFGGAGAQHACAIAASLGIGRILLHPLAGVLSAFGMGVADVTRFAERSVLAPLSPNTLAELDAVFDALAAELRGQVIAEGIDEGRIEPPVRLLDLRYAGEDAPITVTEPGDGNWAGVFERMHLQLYGHAHTDRPVEIATLRVELTGRTLKHDTPTEPAVDRTADPVGHREVWFDGVAHRTALYDRESLRPGDRVEGPAVIAEAYSTIVVDPGWSAKMTERRDVVVEYRGGGVKRAKPQAAEGAKPRAAEAEADPVRLELFNNHFTHIATQMGLTLRRTALSVNVKERLDFSCAILDAGGDLVVNAPHIPVHLGAMGECVRGLIAAVGDDLRPGDVYIANDPDTGGSHLPDLTVMSPVFDERGDELRFFVASRAHHAEVGGLRPGSAFPFARNLAEEGVVLRNLRIARGGVFDEAALRRALAEGPYPSRSPDENVADVRAQMAAGEVGRRELEALIAAMGWATVKAYMGHIRSAAEFAARRRIAELPDGRYEFADALGDGAPVCIAITVAGDAMTVDFTGTGPVNANSLNANRAIVRAALMYGVRCLIDADIPLNAGLMEPVSVVLPPCMLDPPHEPDARRHAAVVGGNVELSQRIVDVFFGALGVAAASQGTMNNFVFGSERFGYYETICGGAGAGPGFDGASAVHTHMTNTRLTDVEVIERRFPVRVRRFAIRRGSGGAGAHRGGDGVERVIEFLAPLSVSLLTQRRTRGPFGLAGGSSGQPGRNTLRRAGSNADENHGPLAEFDAQPGDVLMIATPGGGGYGACSHDANGTEHGPKGRR